jgi:hypothetical protein
MKSSIKICSRLEQASQVIYNKFINGQLYCRSYPTIHHAHKMKRFTSNSSMSKDPHPAGIINETLHENLCNIFKKMYAIINHEIVNNKPWWVRMRHPSIP